MSAKRSSDEGSDADTHENKRKYELKNIKTSGHMTVGFQPG